MLGYYAQKLVLDYFYENKYSGYDMEIDRVFYPLEYDVENVKKELDISLPHGRFVYFIIKKTDDGDVLHVFACSNNVDVGKLKKNVYLV